MVQCSVPITCRLIVYYLFGRPPTTTPYLAVAKHICSRHDMFGVEEHCCDCSPPLSSNLLPPSFPSSLPSLSLPSSYILPTPLLSSLHSPPSRWINLHTSRCGHRPSHTTPAVQAASTTDAPTAGVGTAATERAQEKP